MPVDSKDLLAKLQSEPAPVSLAKLKKAYVSKKAGTTEEDLLAALTAGGIFTWPKTSYWHIDPTVQLRTQILDLCAQKAMKRTEIKVKGHAPKKLSATIDQLIADRLLLKYPALTGSSVVLVSADSPQAYSTYVWAFVAEKLRRAGIEEPGLEEKVWEILPKLESEKDVPVSTARVRRALGLAEQDKKRFDEAVLKLREQRRVYLSQHDHPLGLSTEDRDLLIDGGDGRYYVAITWRER
jgi:hypothetical protein